MKKGIRLKASAAKSAKAKKKGTSKVVTIAEDVQEHEDQKHYEDKHPSRLRRGMMSVTEIRELSNFLLENVQNLNAVAQKMDKNGISEFRVDGVTKGRRGKIEIAIFSANLNRSLTDAKIR